MRQIAVVTGTANEVVKEGIDVEVAIGDVVAEEDHISAGRTPASLYLRFIGSIEEIYPRANKKGFPTRVRFFHFSLSSN